jgi:hypothetical protein
MLPAYDLVPVGSADWAAERFPEIHPAILASALSLYFALAAQSSGDDLGCGSCVEPVLSLRVQDLRPLTLLVRLTTLGPESVAALNNG